MSLTSLCNDTITIRTKSASPNTYGEYTYTNSSANARVSIKAKETQNQTGQTVTSYAYIITDQFVDYEYKIILEDGKERDVLNVNRINNRAGDFDHSEVWV